MAMYSPTSNISSMATLNHSLSTVPPTGQESLNPDETCKTFLFIIYVLVFGSIGVIGLMGNTLSLIVLNWEKRNLVATFLLQALCVSDNLFLATNLFVQVFSGLGIYKKWPVYEDTQPYLMVYVWPFIHITQFGTIWMTVLVAANRYIAICRPFEAHRLCTMRRVRIQVLTVAVVAVLYNIPRFLEYKLVYEQDVHTNQTQVGGAATPMKNQMSYKIIYDAVLYNIFVFLGPLIILIYLNVRLVQELFRARQRLVSRQIPIPGEEEEQNLTLVMVVIILIFVVCQTPASMNALLSYFMEEHYDCGTAYYYFYHLSNLLACANSATNFFVYFFFRQTFRERLRAFCVRYRTPLKHTNTSTLQGKTMAVYSSEGRNLNGEAI